MGKKSRKLDTNNYQQQEDEEESFQNFDPKSREKRRNRRKMKNKFDNAVRQSKYNNSNTRYDEEWLLDEDLSAITDDEY
jgi:hypothetical protein